ncbi:MAG: hypothetical protein KGH60_00475 [Candidatus Micrarchaeota archaeon]|nr:hypothetical protein [Candidatus Micrarchaeota archaeon]
MSILDKRHAQSMLRALGIVSIPLVFAGFLAMSHAAGSAGILPELDSIKLTLSQVGPALSAILFVVAGIFYAIGQMLPPDKKANFHTTAVNVIIGAIVVGILSFASTSLAAASSHLLSNVTANATNVTG